MEEEEEDDDDEDSDQEKSDARPMVAGSENPTAVAVARRWLESIQDEEAGGSCDEFLNALDDAGAISAAARVAMLVEIGAFENEQDFVTSKKDSRNLLYLWATASADRHPYCLLGKPQLLKIAKNLGIKGVHEGWKENTIIVKIIKQQAEARRETE